MGEDSSGKWYTNPAIIAAIITGIFTVISVFIGKKNDPPVQPLPSQTVSTTTTIIVTPAPPLQNSPNSWKKIASEQAVIQVEPLARQKYSVAMPVQKEPSGIFQDDFEGRLRQWRIKRYPGYYNDSMRWHRSDKVSFSGKYSLSLGHEDTDRKDNNDVVHIETKEDFLLTADSLLSFQIKKEYRINLKIVLKDKDAPFKDTVIKFYPGNSEYKEWRAEELLLGSDIDEGRYTLMLKAWDQGRLYLDDIKIQH
ncbi:MAG: hypothetical protein D3915_04520 [Candidatus Electrothrix sp. AU1_5]|nr:hypothetical protein [Candidatus Electrothrix gigas]